MNGAGNDFVLIDNRARKVTLSREQVVRLCDRHRGVGADGLLILAPAASGKADWAWEFYNSDGSTGEMCGNGARCFARFVQRRLGTNRGVTFETGAGIITASFHGESVTVNLTEPIDLHLHEQVPLSAGAQTIHSLNTGVPHAVLFVPDADQAAVQQLGPEIRRHPHFGPKGTNVNFAQLLGPNQAGERETLPSALYVPHPDEFPMDAMRLPWSSMPDNTIIGHFAREHGALIGSRLTARPGRAGSQDRLLRVAGLHARRPHVGPGHGTRLAAGNPCRAGAIFAGRPRGFLRHI